MKKLRKIAIIGAGIFGTTIALRLSSSGYKCVIFEQKKDILLSASRVNQYRFHRGYHYPRSISTLKQLSETSPFFLKEYGDAVDDSFVHLYGLATNNSHINTDDYISFLEKSNLKYKVTDKFNYLVTDQVNELFEVEESLINYSKLKFIIKERINNQENLTVKLGKKFSRDLIDEYDHIITCGYGMCQNLLPDDFQPFYKYQLVEKIVVKPPEELKNISLVIIDGPFMCIDPLPLTNLSILGNVKNAIHSSKIGKELPNFKEVTINPWEDILKKSQSRFELFINHGKQYINYFDKCKFEYSMTGFRVIKPNVERTDERTTIISTQGKFIDIFSGKIDTCSWAANEVLNLLVKM